MIDFLRALRDHTAYWRRASGFVPAFLIAEFFYKFKSFALECIAFLLTWLILDFLIDLVLGPPDREEATGR